MMFVSYRSMNMNAENKLRYLVKYVLQYFGKEPIDLLLPPFNNGITCIIYII